MCTCGRSFCRWLPVLFVVALIAWCYVIFTLDVLQKQYLSLNADDPPTEIGSHAQGVAYMIAFTIATYTVLRFHTPKFVLLHRNTNSAGIV